MISETGPSPKPDVSKLTMLREPRWEAIREVNRSRAILAAGSRAMMMQIAHPWVAQSIHDTGYFAHDPLARLRGTAEAGMSLIYDTPQDAMAIARRVRGMHVKVNSKPEKERVLTQDLGPHYRKGDVYNAENQEAQKWVAATIIDSTIIGHETFVGPLTDEKKDRYLIEAKELFSALGLKPDRLPDTYKELQEYIQEMISSQRIIVSDIARDIAPKTMLSGVFPGAEVLMSYQKLTTLALLPEELRKQFKLQRLKYGQKPFFNLSAAFLRTVLPYVPGVVRLNPQARQAEKRARETKKAA